MASNARLQCYALLLLLVLTILPKPDQAIASSTHRALLQTCQPNGSIPGKSGDCNPDNGSECCVDGSTYETYDCSPLVTASTSATLTLNSFARGKDGGGPAECTGTFFPDDQMVVALSTGWYGGGRRCNTSIVIRTADGSSATAMVVDECDSLRGCDTEHNFELPCANNIVDGSPAVWDTLGLDKDVGKVQITWSDA